MRRYRKTLNKRIIMSHIKISIRTRYQWLTPVYSYSGGRKITVWSQPEKIVLDTLSRKNPLQKRTGE
jgi:hypothetical protein